MGKKKVKAPDEVDGNVNMSPMIDCCFLLLIFFVVNATQITVAKDPSISMPKAYQPGKLEDANGCIVINVYADVDVMEKRVGRDGTSPSLTKFRDSGFTDDVHWSVLRDSKDDSGSGKYRGFTESELDQLTDYVKAQKEAMINQGKEEGQIRIYMRADTEATWDRTYKAVARAALGGVSNIVYGTLPAKVD